MDGPVQDRQEVHLGLSDAVGNVYIFSEWFACVTKLLDFFFSPGFGVAILVTVVVIAASKPPSS